MSWRLNDISLKSFVEDGNPGGVFDVDIVLMLVDCYRTLHVFKLVNRLQTDRRNYCDQATKTTRFC